MQVRNQIVDATVNRPFTRHKQCCHNLPRHEITREEAITSSAKLYSSGLLEIVVDDSRWQPADQSPPGLSPAAPVVYIFVTNRIARLICALLSGSILQFSMHFLRVCTNRTRNGRNFLEACSLASVTVYTVSRSVAYSPIP